MPRTKIRFQYCLLKIVEILSSLSTIMKTLKKITIYNSRNLIVFIDLSVKDGFAKNLQQQKFNCLYRRSNVSKEIIIYNSRNLIVFIDATSYTRQTYLQQQKFNCLYRHSSDRHNQQYLQQQKFNRLYRLSANRTGRSTIVEI